MVLYICDLRFSAVPMATKENMVVALITEGGSPVIKAYSQSAQSVKSVLNILLFALLNAIEKISCSIM